MRGEELNRPIFKCCIEFSCEKSRELDKSLSFSTLEAIKLNNNVEVFLCARFSLFFNNVCDVVKLLLVVIATFLKECLNVFFSCKNWSKNINQILKSEGS